jgi:protein tyrosine/serine phosphatase
MKYQQSFRRISTISILSCFAAAASGASLPLSGVSNFYKVDAQVYRGAQPNLEGFTSLAKLGVKTVIDLRELGEHSQAAEEAMVKGLNMQYLSIPMKKRAAPSADLMARILGLLNDKSVGPVFVHCKRGADRTGAVIACYRITHDSWDGSKALSEARDDGMSMFQRSLQHYVMKFTPIPAAQQPVQAAEIPTVKQ